MRMLPLVLCVACGAYASPDEFADALAEAQCAQLERCALGVFEASYSSDDACLREQSDALVVQADQLDQLGCTWLPDEAKACVHRVRGLSCEEWALGLDDDACDLVWRCDQGPGVPPMEGR
ncbi:MAG: hypothetical protein R3F59_26755 [Myxococcota bacterium]